MIMEKFFFGVALVAMVGVHYLTDNITYSIGTFAGLYTILLCLSFALYSRHKYHIADSSVLPQCPKHTGS